VKRLVGNVIGLVGETSWLLFCFFAVSFAFGVLLVVWPALETAVDSTIGQLLSGVAIYLGVLLLTLLPLWLARGKKRVVQTLAIDRKPPVNIVWLPLVLWATYMFATIVVGVIVSRFVPWIDTEQVQDVGFQALSQPLDYVVAFVGLVVLPPIIEELLFRGYLFSRLRSRFGFLITTLTVSAAFGLVHLQWNVGIDVAILSVFACYLRELTGSVWASMVLHGIKNGLAYFLLFIGPLIGLNLLQ